MYKAYFSFDFLSPFSYLTWKILNRDLDQFNNVEFILRPVAMAIVIREFQPAGPAEIPVKRDYLTRECLRISAIQDIPFKAPFKLPFISTDLLRSVCALEGEDKWQWKLTDELFEAIWSFKKDPEDIEALLSSSTLPELIKSKCFDKNARRTLKHNNKLAITEKLFGVPSFSIYRDDSLEDVFWGLSSMDHLKLYLDNRLTIDTKTFDEFNGLF